VIIPELPEVSEHSSITTKRRQFSPSEEPNKKARREPEQSKGDAPMSRPPEGEAKLPRLNRRPTEADEKNRGRRLFGALLGTLSQGSSSTAQARRSDIDRRQQEKLKAQTEEDEGKKVERLGKLREICIKEQKKFDQQTVRRL